MEGIVINPKRVIVSTAGRRVAKTVWAILGILFLLPSLSFSQDKQPQTPASEDYVILLHGLARSERSMRKLEKALINHGYRVINVDYPSTKYPIEYLAENVLSKVISSCDSSPETKIHFVTHSMGGIIVRYFLKHYGIPNLGRVVMLSPPNQGSELVDHLKDSIIFKKRNGPAGQQLGTDTDSLPLKLGPVDFELGVITGDRSFNPVSSMILPGPDDGVVSVAQAKVKGMADFIVMPNTHTFIMKSKSVIRQVLHFLEHGEFVHKRS
jgi:triacylglycerol lipase